MESVIYYFSGSGNSYKIAKDMASKIENTKLIKISLNYMDIASKNKYKRIGIVFPVYYFALPKIIEEFVKKLEIPTDSYVFAVATCGGQVGFSLKQLENLLREKGTTLSAGFSVVMPDNYQILFSPLSIEKQEKLFIAVEKSLADIIEKVNKSEVIEIKTSSFDKIATKFMKQIFKPKNKDKKFWVDNKCIECGICAKVCPVNNIEMNNKPKWLHNCEHCLACMQWCPKHSIQYRKSTIKRGRYHHPDVTVKDMINKLDKCK